MVIFFRIINIKKNLNNLCANKWALKIYFKKSYQKLFANKSYIYTNPLTREEWDTRSIFYVTFNRFEFRTLLFLDQ